MAKKTKPSAKTATAKKSSRKGGKAKPTPLLEFEGSFGVTFSGDGSLLATAGKRTPTVWDVAAGKMIAKCEMFKNTSELAFSPNGKLVAGFSTAGEVSVCDARTGKSVAKSKDCRDEGSFISFSPSGRALVVANWDGEIWSWNTKTWKAKRVVKDGGHFCRGLFLPDGSLLIGDMETSGDEFVRYLSIYNWPHKGKPRRISCDSDPNYVAFHPQSKRVAVGGYTLAIFDLSKGKLLKEIKTTSFDALAWSPIGELLAVIDDDELILYDSKTWKAIQKLKVEYGADLAFSPDGKLLAVAGWKSGEIWDVNNLLSA